MSSSASSSSAYAYKPGGSLKLKGGEDIKDRKKKSKSKSSLSVEHKHASAKSGAQPSSSKDRRDDTVAEELHRESPDGKSRPSGHIMTDSERKFEEARRKRLQDKIRKEAKTSHKEKVEAFNKYLGSLSEHHDIPKVGPG